VYFAGLGEIILWNNLFISQEEGVGIGADHYFLKEKSTYYLLNLMNLYFGYLIKI
jgi:hypothetical protein